MHRYRELTLNLNTENSFSAMMPWVGSKISNLKTHCMLGKKKMKVLVAQSYLTVCDPMGSNLCPWDSPGKNPGVGSHSLLQGNLPDPGIELGSPALQADFWPREPQGSPHSACDQCVKLVFAGKSIHSKSLPRICYDTAWCIEATQWPE